MVEKQPDPRFKKLAEPFQFDDADIIIRTRDADFPAHKLILSYASTVFKDMFSVPCSQTTPQEGPPIVEVTEDAQTIHDILSWIYPNGDNVSFDDFPTLHRLVLGMRKYAIPNLKIIVADTLIRKAAEDPLRVFAIACNAEAPQIALIAAHHALKLEFVDIGTANIPELNSLRVNTMSKLLRYHKQCGVAASSRILHHALQFPIAYHPFQTMASKRGTMDCTRWWKDYVARTAELSKSRPIQLDYTSTKVIGEYCRGIENCTVCSRLAALKLIDFGERVEREVKEAIAQVQGLLMSMGYIC